MKLPRSRSKRDRNGWKICGSVIRVEDGDSNLTYAGKDVLDVAVSTVFHQYYDALVTVQFADGHSYSFVHGDSVERDLATWLERQAGFDGEPIRFAALNFVVEPVTLSRLDGRQVHSDQSLDADERSSS